ncbi:MAG: hypothetical protein WAV31_01435 [Candidatus Moraniibacteriota bacterium]
MFPETPPTIKSHEQESTLERWLSLELKNQYESKAKILNQLGIISPMPRTWIDENNETQIDGTDVKMRILGIDGQTYDLPRMEEIKTAILENKEMFEKKMKQGFTDLNIIPFAMPLDQLIKTMERTLIKHHKEGKLFTLKKNIDDENEKLEPLELGSEPVNKWEGYDNADTEGKIVYYPKKFIRDNHQGQTKKEILEKTKKGFIVTFNEKNPNIPKENQNEIIGERKRLEANKASNDYLEMLQTEAQYQNEQGQIPEEWIAKFLTTLEKYNQVIDGYRGNGKASFQLGAYFPFSGNVPNAYWFRAGRRANFGRYDPEYRNGDYGARSSVRVL